MLIFEKKYSVMIRISFTPEESDRLQYERHQQSHPLVQKKMEVLYLKSLELSHELIAKIAGVSANTMLSYFRDYQNGGIDKLKVVNSYHPQSKLAEHKQTIEAYFKSNPPRSISEASAKIEELTGIKRSLTQTGVFLKGMGMKLIKTGPIPGKAITELKKKSKKNF